MTPQAIGMVETEGLIAAIEACDAMCKAARVEMVEQSITHPALVTIMVRGEVAAVRAAVDAGATAAAKVGAVISTHVIARPHETLLPGLTEPPDNPHLQKTSGPPDGTRPASSELSPPADLTGMSVVELRYLARRLPGFPLSGRQISRARRDILLQHLRDHYS